MPGGKCKKNISEYKHTRGILKWYYSSSNLSETYFTQGMALKKTLKKIIASAILESKFQKRESVVWDIR